MYSLPRRSEIPHFAICSSSYKTLVGTLVVNTLRKFWSLDISVLLLNLVIHLRIYLVRHAKTDWNDKEIWQGNVDIPLNEGGFAQAEKLAQRFSKLSISAVYTSPLLRCYQTAQKIAENFSLSPVVEADLRECEISLWNGLTMKETLERYEPAYREWSTNPEAKIDGVESLGAVQRRVVQAITDIVKYHQDQDVVVVSHAIAIRMIVCWVLELPIPLHKNFRLENASVTAVEFSSKPRILYLNDTCHLEE